MANFTEGEWKSEKSADSYEIWAYDKDCNLCKLLGYGTVNKYDSRLMAQSKKMYEGIKKLFNSDYKLYYLTKQELETWANKMRAILSEIDKD